MRATVLSLVLLTACAGYDDLALLEIETVEPLEIEPGTTLRVHGAGFPLGRTPEITLRGSIFQPGRPSTTVDATLVGRVRSGSLIEVPIGVDAIDAIGGRATVDGELRVGFASAHGLREVFASERIRLDFLPDTAAQLRVEGPPETRSEHRWAEDFGLELSREELGSAGVRVVGVAPGSLAARQGVQPGDAVMGLDGLSIYASRDFVPDPSKTQSTVLVTRKGLRGVHALRWPHEVTQASLDPVATAAFVLLGLLLGWLSPLALCIRPEHEKAPTATWLIRSGLTFGFAILMSFFPSLQWTTMWILILGTFAALFALASRDRIGTSSFAFTVVATLTVMLAARSASIVEIMSTQSPEISRWWAFRSPASFVALGPFLSAVGTIGARDRLSASLFAAPAAVLGAALFLGGWPVQTPVTGVLILTAKAVAMLVIAQAVSFDARVVAIASIVGIGLALAGLVLDLDGLLPHWNALAIGAVCALAARALTPPLRRLSAPVPV